MFRRKKRTTIDPDMDPSFLSSKPVGDWTVGEVCHWLKYIGLGQYQDAFFFNEVDGDMLLEIDDDDLITLPVEKITHRRKILRRMEALKGGGPVGGVSESDSISEYSQVGSDVGSDAGSMCGDGDGMGPGGVVQVKCVYHEDVRKFPLSPRDTFEDFIKLVEEEWGSGKGVKYKDEEGDMVQVRETDELKGVYQMSRVRRVRLVVYSLKKKKRHHHHHHHHKEGSGSGSDGGSVSGSERSGSSSRRGSLKRRGSSSSIGDVGVLEHFVDPVVISNRRGMITFFNSSAEMLFGWERGEVIGKNVSVLMGPGIAVKHNSYIRRYRKEGNPRIIGKGRQVQALLKNGEMVNIWITISETNTSFIATIRALTPAEPKEEGKETEKEKEDVEKRITHNHRNLEKELKGLNDYPTAVLVMDEGGIIQYTNTKANEELGYQEGGLLGMGMWVVCSAICSEGNEGDLLQEYKRFRKQHKKERKKEKEKEKGERGKNKELGMGLLEGGRRRDVICFTANKHVKAFKCEFSDRKHMGKALYVCSLRPQTEPSSSAPTSKGLSMGAQKILNQQREVTSTLIVPAFIMNGNGMVFESNTTCCDVFGVCITEIIGQDLSTLLPESAEENEWVKSFLSGGGKDSHNKVTGVRGDGKEISLNLFVNKVHDTEDRGTEETFFTCILQKIAEDEEEDEIDILAKQSVVLSQQVDVISNLAVPACVMTHDSKIRAFNAGCEQLFGFTLDEVVGKDCGVLMPQGEIREKHPIFVANYAAGKKKERDSVVVGKGRRVVGRHKEGHNVSTFLSVTERKDGELSFFTGVFS